MNLHHSTTKYQIWKRNNILGAKGLKRLCCMSFMLSLFLIVGCFNGVNYGSYSSSISSRSYSGNPFNRETYVQSTNPFDKKTYRQSANPFDKKTYRQNTNPFNKDTYIQNTNPFNKETYRQGPFFDCP